MARTIRIQKYLSDRGILSRRKTEEYIKAGRIEVNGHKAAAGYAVDPANDIIAIDGQRVEIAARKRDVYLMLNKPRGYVTTTSDDKGRKCITELLEGFNERVYPVGRLDMGSEGLLLLTNDGDFANYIMHPSHHVSKTYRATVRPDVTDEQAAQLAAGVDIGQDGNREMTAPAVVQVVSKEPGRVVLQITIREGKNRQIRRMCEAVGLEVARLRRISIGPIKLGMLQPGEWRELTPKEVGALRGAVKEMPTPAKTASRGAAAQKPYSSKPYSKEGGGFKDGPRPYKRREEGEGQGQKPYQSKPYSKEGGGFKDGPRPYKRREDGEGQGQKSYQSKPYSKEGGGFKDGPRPSKRRDDGEGQGQKPYQSKPYAKDSGGFKDGPRPYKRREAGEGQKPYQSKPYSKEGGGFKDGPRPYKRREEGQGQKPYQSKPYSKEGGGFKSGAGSSTKPTGGGRSGGKGNGGRGK